MQLGLQACWGSTRLARGLYRVVKAVIADADERMLEEGLSVLAAVRSIGDTMDIGGSILLQTLDGEREVPIGSAGPICR